LGSLQYDEIKTNRGGADEVSGRCSDTLVTTKDKIFQYVED